MPLLKSLICFKGFDNGRRFLVINLIAYGLFLLISSVLAKAVVLLIFFLMVATPVMLASAVRRVRDAGFNLFLAGIPLVVFLVCVFAITYVEHKAIYALLVLVVLVTLAMTALSNAQARRKRSYVLGYFGPIDLSANASEESNQPLHQRIEPTLVARNPDNPDNADSAQTISQTESITDLGLEIPQESMNEEIRFDIEPEVAYADKSNSANNIFNQWEKKLHLWLQHNRPLSIALASGLALITLILVIWSLSGNEETVTPDTSNTEQIAIDKERLNKLEMPDNYWLMLDQHNALTIAWQGSPHEDGEFWSASTGTGDKDCVEVRFDNGDKVRSLAVTVKNNGDYYADFSPIDTKKLVESIAQRSRFKLCGIEFSLKGTQAMLMSHKKYSTYIENSY